MLFQHGGVVGYQVEEIQDRTLHVEHAGSDHLIGGIGNVLSEEGLKFRRIRGVDLVAGLGRLDVTELPIVAHHQDLLGAQQRRECLGNGHLRRFVDDHQIEHVPLKRDIFREFADAGDDAGKGVP